MEAAELTSGASGRIIPVFRNLRRSVLSYDAFLRGVVFIKSLFLWMILLLLPRRHRSASPPSSPRSDAVSEAWLKKRKFRKDEEDTLRRRALAEALLMVAAGDRDADAVESGNETGSGRCLWSTSLFYGVRRNALFCRSWLPVFGEMKCDMVL